MEQEKKLQLEHALEDAHSKSLVVCDLVAQGTTLKTALSLQKLDAAVFYRARRDNPDVQKAWRDAQEILADIKMSELSDMGTQLIREEGLTTNTFNAVTKNERWIVEKLNPAAYGPRPTQQTAVVQTNVQILHTLTDEQILAIANGTQGLPEPAAVTQQQPVQQIDKKPLDNTIEAEYTAIDDGEHLFSPENIATKDNSSISQPAVDLVHSTPADSNTGGGSSYDLSAFGDFS